MSTQVGFTFPEVDSRAQKDASSVESMIELTKLLVREQSEPNKDKTRVLSVLANWFSQRGLSYTILEAPGREKKKNRKLGLLAELGSATSGRTICITACLDTAPIGSKNDWDYGPLSAQEINGKLFGRGAADSKVAVSIFAHLFQYFTHDWTGRQGRLLFLADTDEHNGRFGAIKSLIAEYGPIDFVYIGYPGNNLIRNGSRGFARFRAYVYGEAEHSGSRNLKPKNAIVKATKLVSILEQMKLPHDDSGSFDFGPKMTVTEISGGGGYTNVPDRCRVSIDVRLTPQFPKTSAFEVLRKARAQLDSEFPTGKDTLLRRESSWPAYEIPTDRAELRVLKKHAQKRLGRPVGTKVTGPSNVGNFLYEQGIFATSGFGVSYENIHAPNECIFLDTIEPIFLIYRDTISELTT